MTNNFHIPLGAEQQAVAVDLQGGSSICST